MSRIEKLLKAIINNTTYDEPRLSRIEEIFYSILYSLPYNADAQSRIEALLLALKESGLYDKRTLSRIEEILKCKLDGSTYTGWIGSRVEMLLNEWELSEIIEATFTSFPIIIKANGEPLLDYTIYGNAAQSGTPTSDNPIMPQGTGERTGNLFDESTAVAGYGVDNNSGNLFRSAALSASDYINISGESYIRATYITSGVANQYGAFYDENKTYISGYSGYSNAIAVPQNAVYTRITARKEYIDEFMLNSGSTPLPYEPYGYKLDISSGDTTTPIYLGEVETTRKIGKYIFDGTEQWQRTANGAYYLASSVTPITDFWHDLSITSFNSHFAAQENVTGSSSVANNKSAFYGGSTLATKEYYIAARDIADVTDFKSYLAAQYAAGTPVTVWYVLATATTGIVNEPLMKIGDYADTLSMEQAGVSIPTLNKPNNTVIDVETELKPSKMYVKYNGEGTRVYITSDGKLYITSNNEIYVLKR